MSANSNKAASLVSKGQEDPVIKEAEGKSVQAKLEGEERCRWSSRALGDGIGSDIVGPKVLTIRAEVSEPTGDQGIGYANRRIRCISSSKI